MDGCGRGREASLVWIMVSPRGLGPITRNFTPVGGGEERAARRTGARVPVSPAGCLELFEAPCDARAVTIRTMSSYSALEDPLGSYTIVEVDGRRYRSYNDAGEERAGRSGRDAAPSRFAVDDEKRIAEARER